MQNLALLIIAAGCFTWLTHHQWCWAAFRM